MARFRYEYEEYENYEEATKDASWKEPQTIGCGFCYNQKKKREIPLFFLDNANNMRPCVWCPYCGRKYKNEA